MKEENTVLKSEIELGDINLTDNEEAEIRKLLYRSEIFWHHTTPARAPYDFADTKAES
jgi:hypothetical protein